MIQNVHERLLDATPDEVWGLVLRLGSPQDALWPTGWPALRFAGALAVGAAGGHGPIRYAVASCHPTTGLVLRFAPASGLVGTHSFQVQDRPDGTVLRHTITARPVGWGRVRWPILIRPLHDALLEELLDRAATATGHPPSVPHRRTRLVRLLRAVRAPRARPTPMPASSLATSGLDRVDWADAYRVPLAAGAPRDPDRWRRLVFGSRGGAFEVLAAGPDEVLVGSDHRHLDFRAALAVVSGQGPGSAALVVTTAVRFQNAWGRRYMARVAPFHRRIVPAMMRRAARVAEQQP